MDPFALIGYQKVIAWILVQFQCVEDIDSLAVVAVQYNQPFFDPVYWPRVILQENRSRQGIIQWLIHLNHPQWLEADRNVEHVGLCTIEEFLQCRNVCSRCDTKRIDTKRNENCCQGSVEGLKTL